MLEDSPEILTGGPAVDEHRFSVVVRGVVLDEQAADAVYGAGCDDATIVSREGQTFIHFDREADSLLAAIRSAVTDVARGLAGVGVDAPVAVVADPDAGVDDLAGPAILLANAALDAGRLMAATGKRLD